MRRLLLRILERIESRRDRRAVAATSAPAPPIDELLGLGERQEQEGRFDAALELYQQAVAAAPQSSRAQVYLGNALYALGRSDEAGLHYRKAIALTPEYAAAHLNLGNALMAAGDFGGALTAYREAARLRPEWADAWAGVGCALEEAAQPRDAIEAYRQALQRDPAHAGAAFNLSGVLLSAGEATAAREVLQEALRRVPGHAALQRALADLHRRLGEHADAARIFRQVLKVNPDDAEAASNLLLTLNFLPEANAADLLHEHQAWGDRLVARHAPVPVATHAQPDRRLRIGYVSPDFASHPVSLFLEPLLRAHDRSAVQVFCYANNAVDDEVTGRIRELADRWRPIQSMTDDAAAALIRDDAIDILVDLAGHTFRNRLGIFARKPAPIEMTWLGYLCTTGLRTVDYRICDRHTDPEGVAEQWQVERPARLPDSQWCYQAPVEVQPSAALPRLANGYWTFGSFNQVPKLNDPLLDAWARVLSAVPDSRLRIAAVTDRAVHDRLRASFGRCGVTAERIEILGRVPAAEYLASYAEVDIALDSFPYTGGTTTCDALHMGVPVATVAGHRAVARSGVSLLTTAGLADWIADSLDDLPEMIRRKAADPDAVANVRRELPGRMRASPLMDHRRFARNVESLYRSAWREWCARKPAGNP